MSDDPIRLLDESPPELSELRDALREARQQAPDVAWHDRMANAIDNAQGGSGDINVPTMWEDESIEDERPSIEDTRPPLDPTSAHHAEVSSETHFIDTSPDVVEAEVGGGLATGLLVAGAAITWLSRRAAWPQRDDEDS